MSSPDTSFAYLLTNLWSGPSQYLTSAYPAGLTIAPAAINTTTQQWYLNATSIQGYYTLRTRAEGDGLSLDVLNNNGTDSTSVVFATTADVSGQLWKFDSLSDGTWRLSNDFTGPDKHLDIYADTYQPFLAAGDASGQHWRFVRVNVTVSSTSTSSTVTTVTSSSSSKDPTTSTATTASASSAVTSSVTSSANQENNTSVSPGAIAGIVVGVAILLAIVAAIGFAMARRRKETRQTRGEAVEVAGRPVSELGMSNEKPVEGSAVHELPSTMHPQNPWTVAEMPGNTRLG